MKTNLKLFNLIPIILLGVNTNIIDIIGLIWLLLLYTYIFEKRYNYTYIIYIYHILYIMLTISTLYFILMKKQEYMVRGYTSCFFTDFTKISITLYCDTLSANFILLTSLLSSIIVLYAYNYMKYDVHITTFTNLLVFFSISMITLLSAGDVFTLVLGWELIGIASFLLINFWYTKPTALKSAIKAFSFNKLSDVFLFLFVIVVLQEQTSLYLIYKNIFILKNNYLFLLVPLLGCSFCKSVQFGFHLWLPDSMEAPVPASALIHSATLVSAGLYLSYRFSCLLNLFFLEVSLISSFTAFYGSFIAASQTDLKKILAYSTISHCGFLFITVFYSNAFVFLLYLHLHGLFKAFSFILVGFILQNNSIYQDSRVFTHKNRYISFEFFSLPIILINLAGLPLSFGFFSKYFLLTVLSYCWIGSINILFIKLGSLGSILYSINMVRLVFFSKINRNSIIIGNIFTKKWNHIYLMMVVIGLLFITYLYIFIVTGVTSLCVTKTYTTSFLVYFYKIFIITSVYVYNPRSLAIVPFYLITLLYVFF